jgi:hypothetical protein
MYGEDRQLEKTNREEMDTQFISAVMAEQVRLTREVCEAKYELEKERLIHKWEKEKMEKEMTDLQEQLGALRKERDELKAQIEKSRPVSVSSTSVSVDSEILQELRRVREDVKTNDVLPFDLLEPVNEEEKTVTVDDKKAKRREYAREYMKRKREAEKAKSEQE